jgi:hypothetical protein
MDATACHVLFFPAASVTFVDATPTTVAVCVVKKTLIVYVTGAVPGLVTVPDAAQPPEAASHLATCTFALAAGVFGTLVGTSSCGTVSAEIVGVGVAAGVFEHPVMVPSTATAAMVSAAAAVIEKRILQVSLLRAQIQQF